MADVQTEIKHSCGLQGFDPYFDICELCEYRRLLNKDFSEEDAAEIAHLKYFSSGRPSEIGPIERYFKEELRKKLASLGE